MVTKVMGLPACTWHDRKAFLAWAISPHQAVNGRLMRPFTVLRDISGRISGNMNIQRLALVFVCGMLLPLAAFAGKKSAAPVEKTASVNLTVVRDSNGKPVKNAEVVLHLIDNHGKQKQEGMELKTHDDGKAEATGLPYGKVRIQVIAPGFRTYGQDYSIDQPNLEITIKMQRPAEQFSIYK